MSKSPAGSTAKRGGTEWSPLTAADIEQMLDAAGAPKPWIDPSECARAAGHINAIAAEMARYRRSPIKRDAFDRAQDAVEELRRTLPEILLWASLPFPDAFGVAAPPEVASAFEAVLTERTAKLVALNNALFDVSPRKKQRPLEEDWGGRALLLLHWYSTIVDSSARITRNGPAVRFIQTALSRIGEGNRETSAIEAALTRRLKARNHLPEDRRTDMGDL